MKKALTNLSKYAKEMRVYAKKAMGIWRCC